MRRVYRKQVGIIRSRLEKGEKVECFMKDFFASGQWNELEEGQACFLAGVLMEAGSDTTRVSLYQLVAGSASWPDWIQRARAELDKVCGSNAERLPKFSDANDLPLIKAAVKETFRWKSVSLRLDRELFTGLAANSYAGRQMLKLAFHMR